jgi:hypothetical protein
VSLIVAVLAWPLVKTLVYQVGEIVPNVDSYLWVEPYQAVEGVLAHDSQIGAVHVALQSLAYRPKEKFDAATYRRYDPNNGLYDYLALTPLLAAGERGDAALRTAVHVLKSVGPGRLHLTRRYQQMEALWLRAEMPVRVAARGAARVPYLVRPLREPYPRVLREWSAGMLALGKVWREAGRPADAVAAHAAVVRLLDDLVHDSPVPNMAMVVSEVAPVAWEELARDLKANAGSQGDAAASQLATAIRKQAQRAAGLRPRWHAVAGEGVNVLPYTGLSFHVMLAVPEHQRVLATLCAAGLAAATWAILLVLSIFWLVISAVASNPTGIELAWRRRAVSWWLGCLVVCGPVVLAAIGLRMGRIDYAWLLSLPSIWAVLLWPAVVLVLLGLAIRWCTQVTGVAGKCLSPGGGLGVVILFLIILIVLPTGPGSKPWMPPAEILTIRNGGFLLGAGSLVVLVAWIGKALRKAGRVTFAVVAWSRGYLNVTAAALLGMTLIGFGLLLLNHRVDLLHQKAFARAAADPLADRLGPGWLEESVGGGRELLQRIESQVATSVANP